MANSAQTFALESVGPSRPWAGVTLLTTTRWGGVSAAPFDSLNLGVGSGDELEAVRANQALLRGCLPAEPHWLRQVHGDQVQHVDASCASPLGEPEADASVTTALDRVLVVLTADCLPVVIADAQGSVLGVAHAGWRGLALGVLDRTVDEMRRLRPEAQGLKAWLGPAIGPAAFQVGQDVYEAFVSTDLETKAQFATDPTAAGKWLANLPGLAEHRLRKLGVTEIENAALCTVTDPHNRFFSYRRDKKTGRMATVAWLHAESSSI